MTEFKNGSASQWRGVVLFAPDDHDMYRLVQKRVGQKWSWEEIAAEIGCEVKPLCDWVLAYKEPRRDRVPLIRTSQIIDPPKLSIAPAQRPITMQSQRYLNWKRAQEGAAKTRADNA